MAFIFNHIDSGSRIQAAGQQEHLNCLAQMTAFQGSTLLTFYPDRTANQNDSFKHEPPTVKMGYCHEWDRSEIEVQTVEM